MSRALSMLALAALAVAGLAIAGVFTSGTASAKPKPKVVKVTVVMREFKFALSRRSVPTGTTVVFKVVNRGKITHNFKIAGKKTKNLNPGKSATLTVKFAKKGRYAYVCTIPGHAAAGMKGVFAVGVAAVKPTPTPTTTTTDDHHDTDAHDNRAGRHGPDDGHGRDVRIPLRPHAVDGSVRPSDVRDREQGPAGTQLQHHRRQGGKASGAWTVGDLDRRVARGFLQLPVRRAVPCRVRHGRIVHRDAVTRTRACSARGALVSTGVVSACASADAERAAPAGRLDRPARTDRPRRVASTRLSLKLVKTKLITFSALRGLGRTGRQRVHNAQRRTAPGFPTARPCDWSSTPSGGRSNGRTVRAGGCSQLLDRHARRCAEQHGHRRRHRQVSLPRDAARLGRKGAPEIECIPDRLAPVTWCGGCSGLWCSCSRR